MICLADGDGDDGGLSGGAIAGIIVGVIVLIIICVAFVLYLRGNQRKSKSLYMYFNTKKIQISVQFLWWPMRANPEKKIKSRKKNWIPEKKIKSRKKNWIPEKKY